MSPELFVIAGPNGSGKSSSITSSGLDRRCPFLVNPDNFSRCLRDVGDETEGYVAAIKFCERLRHLLLEFEMDFGFENGWVNEREDRIHLRGQGERILDLPAVRLCRKS